MYCIRANDENNVVDAACKGAQFGLQLIGAIIANIIAFVSFVAFINAIICWLGNLIGFENLSFEVSNSTRRKKTAVFNRYRFLICYFICIFLLRLYWEKC